MLHKTADRLPAVAPVRSLEQYQRADIAEAVRRIAANEQYADWSDGRLIVFDPATGEIAFRHNAELVSDID